MGSLMSGWNSPRNKKKFERNMSLTKEEIEHYWRSKKLDHAPEEAASPCSSPSGVKTIQKSNTFSIQEEECISNERAHFLPVSQHREILKSKTFNGREAEVEIQSELVPGSAPGWWTKTDWAFLNERPVIEEGSRFKYTPQYNVTGKLKVDVNGAPSNSTVVF